jgi:regulator of RNase E activity RraA
VSSPSEPRGLSTTLASDALDDLDVRGRVLGPHLHPISGGPFQGPALPVTMVARDDRTARADGLLDVVAAIKPGDVLVLACPADPRAACWGELLARAAQSRGAAALVTTGLVRDARALAELSFAVVAAGTHPVRPDGRLDAVDVGRAVTVDGVRIDRGDVILGDEDGVVVVPADHHDAVCARVEQRRRREAVIRSRLSTGAGLGEALSD